MSASPAVVLLNSFHPRRFDARLAPYLHRTLFCDARHAAVCELASELIVAGDARATAVAMFEWVRDTVVFCFGPWGTTASHTLTVAQGTGTNKTNLLVALWRAVGIPGAYEIRSIDAQRCWGPIAPRWLARHANPYSVQFHAAAHLDGRWVRADAACDRQLADRAQHICRPCHLVEWDGSVDRVDTLDPEHIHACVGLHANADEWLAKPARHATPQALEHANRYLRFIRDHPPFPDAPSIHAAYQRTRDYDAGIEYFRHYMLERDINPTEETQ